MISIPAGSIPSSVKELNIMCNVPEDSFPYKDILAIGSIPNSVTELLLDQKLILHNTKLIPPSVSTLRLNWTSSEVKILDLPPTVTNLIILPGISFNGMLNPCILSPNTLPSTITDLTFPQKGIFLSPGSIPNSIKRLVYTPSSEAPFTQEIIPDTLQELELRDFTDNFSMKLIPPIKSLKKLIVNPQVNINSELFQYLKVPSTLTYLECTLDRITKRILPPTLKTLSLQGDLNGIEIDSVPLSVTTMSFSSPITFPILEGMLPTSLKNLEFHRGITSTTFPFIPKKVKNLSLGPSGPYNPPTAIPSDALPNSVESLLFEKISISKMSSWTIDTLT
eukprot:gene5096-6340_t